MKYAPVVIPTLCRFDHFKSCIESLGNCSGKENTDVYVCLDYPAKPAHEPGYYKICQYLEEAVFPFKSVHIIKRPCNYGEGKNLRECYEQLIFPNYETWILSEDDNVFSPNFLEYINLCLEEYEDDPNITSVSGYSFPISYNAPISSVFKTYCYSPWGAGFWVKKRVEFSMKEFESYFGNRKVMTRLKNNARWLYNTFVSIMYSGRVYADQMVRMRNFINNRYSIAPVLSKVKNIGYDSTGINCGDDGGIHAAQNIDKNEHFTEINLVEIANLNQKYQQYFGKGYKTNIKADVKRLLYYIDSKKGRRRK